MVRRDLIRWSLAGVALVAAGLARPAPADSLSSTGPFAAISGDAEVALPRQPGTLVLTDNPYPSPAGVSGGVPTSNPNDVAQAPWMTSQGLISGWNIQDLRLHYDAATDTMAVGVNFFGTAGDADGNGDPGVADPRTTAAGGVDLPNLGGRESIAVGFDFNHDGKYDVVAGVPSDKRAVGINPTTGKPNVDGFTVAKTLQASTDLGSNFGQALTASMGSNLVADPSKANPDFVFDIQHFSQLPGFDPTQGFGVGAYAGTPDDIIAGEDTVPFTLVSPQDIVHTPEPASVLAWALLAGGSAWALRRRKGAKA